MKLLFEFFFLYRKCLAKSLIFPLSRYAFVEIFGLRFVQDICLAGPRDCKGQKKLPYIGEGVRALSHSH